MIQPRARCIFSATYAIDGSEEPFRIYLTCYRVLDALQDPRATAVLQTARDLLEAYANQIADASLHLSFLENVATHRELLHAAAADGH
jgi:hypothetical protein